METNAFTAALALAASGVAATILPEQLAETLDVARDMARLPLVEPELRTPIGLVTSERAPQPLAVTALIAALAS
jgi:DNA-binding transcriptional LysR family regulator